MTECPTSICSAESFFSKVACGSHPTIKNSQFLPLLPLLRHRRQVLVLDSDRLGLPTEFSSPRLRTQTGMCVARSNKYERGATDVARMDRRHQLFERLERVGGRI